MSTTAHKGKSDQERKAEAEALHQVLVEQIAALRQTDRWVAFLRFAAAFHQYSLTNVLLILAARPTATQVAGYRAWQKLGRQVRRGERGIRIFGCREVAATDDDTDNAEQAADGQDGKARRRRVFFPVSVFDIDQTDPTDPEATTPGEDLAQELTGEDPAGIGEAVAAWLTGQGWTVTRQEMAGTAYGYTTTDGSRRVVIREGIPAAQAAKTVLHEAAHVILHADEDPADYVQHRGIKETEAESVAYIVAGMAGLDTSAYSVGYVAGWADCDPETVKATAGRVLKAAHTLASVLDQQHA